MSAGVIAAPARPAPSVSRRIPFRPAEGWLTLASTIGMVMVLGGSLQDAAWTRDSTRGYANFLPWVGLVGTLFGVFGAKVGWGRWRTHIIGALFGGLLLPLIVGGIAVEPDVHLGWDPAGLSERMSAAFIVARNVWLDLYVNARPYTTMEAHYHLVFGTLVWGAGMLAGFSVFGHRRPLDAVVVVGLVILANMALTEHNQLSLVVLFSAAALLLLIRTHVFEEELTWARRKVGDPASVGQLYIRGGAAFVTAAIIGSVMLTWAASSAPLQGLWADLPRHLQDFAQVLQKIGPPGGDPKGLGIVGFGRSADTAGLWQPSNNVAFRAQLQPGEDREVKWRAGTYSEYTRYGWRWGVPENSDPIAARDPQPDPFGEPNKFIGRRELRLRINPDAFREATIIAPNEILSVDRPTKAISVGQGAYYTSVESADGFGVYNVTSWIPVYEDVQGGITEARLREAGTSYPSELRDIYTALPPDSMGPAAVDLLNRIRALNAPPPDADPTNPYDLARTIERYLSTSATFAYDADVRDERNAQCPSSASSVECFAIIKRGYCEYYASTMAVLLRASNIPARIAYGFLPGKRDTTNTETVTAASAHWWVEAYFPGTGWVEFDPTAQVGQPQAIPSGSIGPPTARPASLPPATFNEPPERTVAPGGVTTTGNGSGAGPFIAIAVILLVGVLALAYAAIRRAPSRPMHPDKAWGSLARLAARLGLGPRPSQTVYEYAGALGDEVPAVRVELTTLARAKVEVAYGRRDLGADRLRRIAEAYHRLRLALLGLLFRRGLRRSKRR